MKNQVLLNNIDIRILSAPDPNQSFGSGSCKKVLDPFGSGSTTLHEPLSILLLGPDRRIGLHFFILQKDLDPKRFRTAGCSLCKNGYLLAIKRGKGLACMLKEKCLGRQRWPSERVGSVLIPTMGLNRFEILLEPIRKVPSPPGQHTLLHFILTNYIQLILFRI